MKVMVLASGSSGNSTYIETTYKKILIDVGISFRRIDTLLQSINANVYDVSALLITHEHIDHTLGLALFLKKTNATLYITCGCYNALLNCHNTAMITELNNCYRNGRIEFINRINKSADYQKIVFDALEITPIPTFHDAVEPVGFIINDDGKRLTYITDTGYIHKSYYPQINNCDCYILECNHDPEILMNSDRTYNLKMRILSDHGHLSNEDALYTLTQIMGDKTKLVFYAHISEECNLWEIIDLTKKRIFDELGVSCEGVEFVFTSRASTKEYEV